MELFHNFKMKKVKLFEEYRMSDMVQEIHRIHGGELDEERINELINEGFFDWIKGVFLNPLKKRKLRQLAEKLVDVRIELGKLKIEQDQVKELQDEAEATAEEDPYAYSTTSRPVPNTSSSSSNDGSAAFQLKEDSLTAMESAIIDNMDAIGQDNETLQKYISTIKLDARMKSTEMLIKLADSEVKRILIKSLKKDKSTVDSLQREIKSSIE